LVYPMVPFPMILNDRFQSHVVNIDAVNVLCAR